MREAVALHADVKKRNHFVERNKRIIQDAVRTGMIGFGALVYNEAPIVIFCDLRNQFSKKGESPFFWAHHEIRIAKNNNWNKNTGK